MPDWHWIETPDTGGQPGQAARSVMRNQMSTVSLLAREVIQNSWDAAQPLRARDGHEFSVTFRFRTLAGDERRQVIGALSLTELAARVEEVGAAALGLPSDDCLSSVTDADGELRVLEIEDRGTHGLFGHPKLKRHSHLYKALYTLGITGKDADGGGSYGFGKSAFIKSSGLRTVFAYSCFEPLEGDPVTRRAIGWCWWNAHEGLSARGLDEECDGRAMFGYPQQGGSGPDKKVVPFEDVTADELAGALGLETRSAADLHSLGTSLLLLDPVIDPGDLVNALSTFWWPALCDGLMHLDVVDYSGQVMHPKPRLRDDLKPFIRAYDIATKPMDAPLAESERLYTGENGTLGLVAEPHAEDVQDDEDLDPNKPQVALIRSPRMVVQYLATWQRKRVPIRGVFVASAEANPALRETEPPAHNEWDTNPGDEVSEEATRTARATLDFVRSRVNQFAREFAPPAASERISLPHFAKYFGKFFSHRIGPPPPPPPGDALPIRITASGPQELHATDSGIVMKSKFVVALRSDAPKDVMAVRIIVKYRIVQDESSLGDEIGIRVQSTSSGVFRKNRESGAYHGELRKGERYAFRVESDPYEDFVTARMGVTVEKDS